MDNLKKLYLNEKDVKAKEILEAIFRIDDDKDYSTSDKKALMTINSVALMCLYDNQKEKEKVVNNFRCGLLDNKF